MATKVQVRGKLVSRPGVYSDIVSGIVNAPQTLSFGNAILIDTGNGAGFAGGRGVNGQGAQGKDALYALSTIQQMQAFVKGGLHWLIAKPIFRPSKDNTVIGVSTLWYIKAATTTKATMTYTLTGGGSNGGVAVIDTFDEGLGANGVLLNTVLTRGYGAKLITNPLDSTTFIFQFYVGTFTGLDANGFPFNNVAEANCVPDLLIQSAPFNKIQDFFSWAVADATFNQYFILRTQTVTGTGAVTGADVTANTGYNIATGGTETYGSTDLDAVLQAISDVDFTHSLCDDTGVANGAGANNMKILDLCNNAKYEKFIVVGGGKNRNEFNQTSNSSFALAKAFNTARALVIHGEPKKTVANVVGFRQYPTLYKAAVVLGRICGITPNTPVTLKDIDIDGEAHPLNETEQEAALDAGVLVTYKDTDFNDFLVLQGVNTLQKNTNLVLEDGTSFDHEVMRIISQINKEMQFDAKIKFYGNKTNGANRNTVSEADLITFMDGFLSNRHAKPGEDNLIITHRNLSVETSGDTRKGKYGIVPNFGVNKLIFIGTIFDQ